MIQCLSFDDPLQQLGGIKCSVYKISEINNHQTKNKEHCHCSVIVAVSSIKDNITSVCIYTLAQSFLLSIFNDLVSNASGTVKSYYSVAQTARTLKEADDISCIHVVKTCDVYDIAYTS